MQICILRAVLLLSLVLAGCVSSPPTRAGIDGAYRARAAARIPQPSLTLAPLVLRPVSSPLASSEVADARGRRPIDPVHAWILGTWETVERQSGSVDGVGQFEFRQDGPLLKWRMVRSGWFTGVHTTQTAAGSVKKVSESTVELNGTYESSNLGNVVGTPVRHSFTRTGSSLRGYEATGSGAQAPLSLRRVQ